MRPNFVIVGAAKSGTTALQSYLASHPDIFMAPFEPWFHAHDLQTRRIETVHAYLALFDSATDAHQAIGEKSVAYMFSSVAFEHLRAFDSRTRIIVLIRNPVELVQSLHSQLLLTLDEDEPDLVRAWQLQERRRLGDSIPSTATTPDLLQYESVARLGSQCERLLTLFPPEQVLFHIFDDLQRSPEQVYDRTIAFLGLAPGGEPDFLPKNETQTYRSQALARFVLRPPVGVRRVADCVKKLMGVGGFGLRRLALKANATRRRRTRLPAAFRHQLVEQFVPEVEKLERILERDLGAWKTLNE